MGTTTYEAIPYPEPTDRARNGSVAMRALAEKVDDRIARWQGTASRDATQVALANNVWTAVAWPAPTDSDNVSNDGTTFTYTGTARWFLVSFGAQIAVNGSQPNGGLRVLHNGSGAAELLHSDNYDSLNAAIPLMLNTGDTIAVQAYANDGSGAAGGAHDRAWLRMVAL